MFGERFCLEKFYPENSETILRYMNFSKFVHLLCTRTLYLARGDQFSDQYEGKETEKSRNIRKIVHGDGAYNENTQLYERNRQCVAVNCWSIGKEWSEPLRLHKM